MLVMARVEVRARPDRDGGAVVADATVVGGRQLFACAETENSLLFEGAMAT
jgi:hypothetical protein